MIYHQHSGLVLYDRSNAIGYECTEGAFWRVYSALIRPSLAPRSTVHSSLIPTDTNNVHETEVSDLSAAMVMMTGCPAPFNAIGDPIYLLFERGAS